MHELKGTKERQSNSFCFGFVSVVYFFLLFGVFKNGIGVGLEQAFSLGLLLIEVIYLPY